MKLWLKAFFSIALISSLAHADFTKGSQTLAVMGGISGSGTEYDYNPGSPEPVSGGGGAFGAQYAYYVSDSPAFAFGFDYLYSPNGDRNDDDLFYNYNTTQRLKSSIGLAIVKLVYPKGLFRPYIFGGIGIHNSTQKLSAVPQTGTWPGGGNEVRTLIDEDKTSAALGSGIGFDLFPTDTFFIGAEIRGTWLAGLDTDDNAAINNAGFEVDSKTGVVQGNILFRAGLKF